MGPGMCRRFAIMAGFFLVLPMTAWAQQTSGIAGLASDTSGGVLPGVVVEVSSPALIEQVRTATTDGEGRFNIVDLRPGTYSVTFTLAGFRTFIREGIELTSGFTAQVNGDLQLGALEESITVTGESPLVDVQNVRRQVLISREMLDVLPTSIQSVQNVLTLTPGMTGFAFKTGEYQGNIGSYHGQGGREVKQNFDGMSIDHATGSIGYVTNPDTVQEMVIQTNGIGAESNVGIQVNQIPKEGGNFFSGSFSGLYNNDSMQTTNLSSELKSRGITSTNLIEYSWASGMSLGGPIRQDKLWFFTAHRGWGYSNLTADVYWNKNQGKSLVYEPDLDRRANRYEWFRSNAARITWQVSESNKINFFMDNQHWCLCRRSSLVQAPEAGGSWDFGPEGLYQVTWHAPLTDRLLFEAGFGATLVHWPASRQPGVTENDISITELSTGFRYNAAAEYNDIQWLDRYAQRFSVSYITGTHAFKTGINIEQSWRKNHYNTNGQVRYGFLNGVPANITQYARPYLDDAIMPADLGIYAQDQWTIRQLTLNLGLRFEYLYAYVPAQTVPATPNGWVAERTFEAVKSVPEWMDLRPRFGAAYDLFGDGRTALKFSLGQYSVKHSVQTAQANNPVTTSINAVRRNWTDTNGDFVPNCDLGDRYENGECGAMSSPDFGGLKILTRYADDVRTGFGVRPYLWDMATEVNHQITDRISVTGGYYRSWYGNFTVTDNLAVTKDDFDPFCVTAPVDSRLPGGGGNEVCGFADIKPAKFGQVNNLVTRASHFGNQTRVNNFYNVSFATTLDRLSLRGGVDMGTSVLDNCFVVDNPSQLVNCRVSTPFEGTAQLKLNGSYELPGEFVVSGVFLNVAGPNYTAGYAASNTVIAPSLGRNLAACGTKDPCSSTTASGTGGGASIVGGVAGLLALMEPQTEFEGRRTQLDVRLTKFINIGSRMRLQANVDIYNVFNAAALVNVISTYGGNWRKPRGFQSGAGAQDARFVQVSGRLTF